MRRFLPLPVRGRSDDGFIIVAVLWILGALATLVSIYAVYVTNTAMSLSVNDDRLQAEASVSAALELTAYRLAAASAEARPTQGTFSFRAGRANVAVEFRSEAARIDLNAAPKSCWPDCSPRSALPMTMPSPTPIGSSAGAPRSAPKIRTTRPTPIGPPAGYKPRQAPFRVWASCGSFWACRRSWSRARCRW